MDRAERVAGGLAELSQWLADQVRGGLATAAEAGYPHWDAIAARMVDAQCSSVAERLRGLALISRSGPGWEGRLLEELALLHLLATAYANREAMPEDLNATVRQRIGFTTRQAAIIAGSTSIAGCASPLVDTWLVLGWRDTEHERIISRRIWLRGAQTRRIALILSFAAAGQTLDESFPPGCHVPAALAYYPGALPLRAAVADRAEPEPGEPPREGTTIAGLLDQWASTLARDPWQESWPVVLTDVTPALKPVPSLADRSGDALPLHPLAAHWPLLAASGGRPLTVAAEHTPRGLWPMTAWQQDAPAVTLQPALARRR
jgi:hypothetical protein